MQCRFIRHHYSSTSFKKYSMNFMTCLGQLTHGSRLNYTIILVLLSGQSKHIPEV